MLKSYYDNRTALDVLVPALRASKAVRGFQGGKGIPLTSAETETVGHMLQLLAPCKSVTTVLQGTKYVTASYAGLSFAVALFTLPQAGPLVRVCSEKAKNVAASLPATSVVKPIAVALAAAIDHRFSSTHKYEVIAMLLDPRFKRPVDEYLAPAWEELGKQFGLEAAVYKLEQQRAEEKEREEKEREDREKGDKDKDKKSKEKEKKAKDTGKSGKDEKEHKAGSSASADTPTGWEASVEDLVSAFGLGQIEPDKPRPHNPEEELTDYLVKEPVPGIKTDPLAWWRENRKKYPVLARLARRFLCLQATSVASERVWSTAGNILTSRRSRLHPLALESLVLIHENYGALRQAHTVDPKMIKGVQDALAVKLNEEKKSE